MRLRAERMTPSVGVSNPLVRSLNIALLRHALSERERDREREIERERERDRERERERERETLRQVDL